MSMKSLLLLFASTILLSSCQQSKKDYIIEQIGESEYQRLMSLNMDDFDQSYEGFRQYGDNYELVSAIIPEYVNRQIKVDH